MSSAPKKGRPRKNLDYRVHARRVSALARRKADLAKYRAPCPPTAEGVEQKWDDAFVKGKIAAAERDIAGLEAAIAKGPL